MKKFLCISILALLTIVGCDKYDPTVIEGEVEDLKSRVIALEQWATTVNSNITALQGIVAALQKADHVTGVTTFASPAPGRHVISFVKSGDITIYNGVAGKDGSNGQDGVDGADGRDGEVPRISVQRDTDGVYYWTLNGTWIIANGNKLRVTGDKGADGSDGQDGVTPQIRINTATNKWEISRGDGAPWETTGIPATGEKGATGDSGNTVFAATGVNDSNPDYVEFTLADGVTKIKVPKYKKLGLNFTPPGIFVPGETKTITYTAEGGVAVIKFLDMPPGWKASVNYSSHVFTITAPATFDSGNKEGEAILLISDNDQNMIMRTINLSAIVGHIVIDGYSGNTVTVYYTDGTQGTIIKSADNSFIVPIDHKIIQSIDLEGGTTIIAGRKADGSVISIKLSGGNLTFRTAVGGYIPIGTYSEFQLINTMNSGSYKQEADLDLLELEWMPIGSVTSAFSGTFDGNNHTLANLKISGNSDRAGLFGSNRGTIRNVHVISGSVSGKNHVGGVCGYNGGGLISGCSNACLVSGSEKHVGGICGYSTYASSSPSSVIACYNTGTVSGSSDNVGGVCGITSSPVIACYNVGSVSGNNNVGGICGSSASSEFSPFSSITACYNTGSVLGNSSVGGVCGASRTIDSWSSSSSITACYNIGSVSGSSSVGGVCGSSSTFASNSSSTITACYWKDLIGDDADYGIGASASHIGTTIFAIGAWPITGTHQQWGTGDGSGNGKYWKSLGSWNGGSPIYPKLYFEE
jgi:hypothetical protein